MTAFTWSAEARTNQAAIQKTTRHTAATIPKTFTVRRTKKGATNGVRNMDPIMTETENEIAAGKRKRKAEKLRKKFA